MTRQRQWQLQRKARGECIQCGRPSESSKRAPSGHRTRCIACAKRNKGES